MSDEFPHICVCGCARRLQTAVTVPPPERSRRAWHWTISTRRLDVMQQSRLSEALVAADVADVKIDEDLRTPPALGEAARAEAEGAWRRAAVASWRLWGSLAILRVPMEFARLSGRGHIDNETVRRHGLRLCC